MCSSDSVPNSPSRWNRTSLFLKIFLAFSLVTIILVMFYIYHKGVWREILGYYKYFFDVKRLQKFLASFGPYAGGMFIILQFLQVFLAPIPGEVTGFVGGFLFGKVPGTFLSLTGLVAGSLMAFSLSRLFGVRFVERVVKKKYMDRFNHFITHRGLHLSFIFFLIPGFPKDSLCYLLGVSRMGYRDFIVMNVFGRFPGTLVLTWQGDAIRGGKYQEFLVLLFGTIALMFTLFLTRNYIIQVFSYCLRVLFGKREETKQTRG